MSPGTSTRHRSAKTMFQVIKNRFLLFDYYKEIPNAADFFNYYWLFGCSKSDPVQVYIRHPKLKQHAMLTAFLSWRLDESCCSGLNPELAMKGACSARVQSCVGRSLWNAEPGANTEGSQWFGSTIFNVLSVSSRFFCCTRHTLIFLQQATMAPECPWRLGLEAIMEVR